MRVVFATQWADLLALAHSQTKGWAFLGNTTFCEFRDKKIIIIAKYKNMGTENFNVM